MNFFGRQSIIDLLHRRVVDLKEGYRQNIALLGPEFIGKTYILEEFLSQLNDERIIPVYIDLKDTDFRNFVQKFSGRFLFSFLRNKKFAPGDNLEVLLEEAQKFIPSTCQQIKKVLQNLLKDRRFEAYRDLLSVAEIFEQETGDFCLIALDEFQNLEEFNLPNAFQELGKKIMVQKKSIYIFTSSLKNKARKILSERLSLLFGNFEVVEVGPFSIKTNLEFIEQALEGYFLEKSYKNFLVDFTAGHPFYLGAICKQLVTNAKQDGQKNIFLNILIDSLEEILFDEWGLLNLHFSKIVSSLGTKKNREAALLILLSINAGNNKLPLILEDPALNKTALSSRLKQLEELSVLTKNGNLFFITDKLFAFWLKFVYQRKQKSLSVSIAVIGMDFKNDLRQRINSFIQISGNELGERITDLLQSFDNELFQLNGRKHKLPSFTSISPLNFNVKISQNLKGLIAYTPSDQWAVVFKEGMILDTDVVAFLDSIKEFKNQISRRVVISINEIETNARLRALQEKMWIWNSADLNFILNLYGKPYIVK